MYNVDTRVIASSTLSVLSPKIEASWLPGRPGPQRWEGPGDVLGRGSPAQMPLCAGTAPPRGSGPGGRRWEGLSRRPGRVQLKEHSTLRTLPSQAWGPRNTRSSAFPEKSKLRMFMGNVTILKCSNYLGSLFVFVFVVLTAWTQSNLPPGPAFLCAGEEGEGGSIGGRGASEGQSPDPSYSPQSPRLLLRGEAPW